MKRIIFFLSLSACALMLNRPAMSQSGFVTLAGKQFKLNGTDIYPMVCCYCFNMIYTGTFAIENIYLSPDFGYGPGLFVPGVVENMPNYEYEDSNQPACLLQIIADFDKIKSMGFNAIRTCGISPGILPNDEPGFVFTTAKNVHPLWYPHTEATAVTISPPYVYDVQQNPGFYHYCRLLDDLLYAAGQAELKVLLDIGAYGYAVSEPHWIDWGNFLKAIAARYKNDTNLMAYVFFEEPYWTDNANHTKSEICGITTLWYDKIHEEDDNHLITIGGCLEEEMWEWDPAVVKVDFISPHPYPATQSWENYSYAQAYDRFLGRLIWLQRNSPVPWILGEMALGAQDDYYEKDSNNNNAWTRYELAPPLVHTADLEVQKQFAEESLEDARNCGASGYSWWQFQETWWVSGLTDDKNHNHDAMGLLRHASFPDPLDPNTTIPLEKPVVEAFVNYPNPPPNPQAVQQPANYGNPFNGTNHIISGYIHDQDGQPIRDAVIYAQNYNDPWDDNITLYGFTDNEGYYEIGTPFNTSLESHFDIMKVSAVGCGVAEHWIDDNTQNPINKIISRPLLYTLILSDESGVQINDEVEYKAISDIEVQDLTIEGNGTIGGTAVFKARNSISVEAEFWAKRGSDVHILTGPFLYDCSLWSDILIEDFQAPENKSLLSEKEVQIEFSVENKEAVKVYPNPAKGLYQIILPEGVEHDHEPIMVQVFNCIGQNIYTKSVHESSFTIDLTDYPAGSYYMKVQLPDQQTIKKIVKL